MARQIKILTSHQEEFLDIFGKEKNASLQFYLTGGTPLAAFYLLHRLSEDIDLFSEKQEVNLLSVRSFIGKVKNKLGLKEVDYRQYFGLHTFQLYFPAAGINC